nr:uncharacterized protein LOC108018498 isoform X2 [Drosophila suzukii]
MPKIKYQLIPTDEQKCVEKKPRKFLMKGAFFFMGLLIIAFYNLRSTGNESKNRTQSLVKMNEITEQVGSSPFERGITSFAAKMSIIKEGKTTGPLEAFTKSYFSQSSDELGTNTSTAIDSEPEVKYFVNSPNCRMPYPNPFAPDILKIYKKQAYKVCDKNRDLITVIFNETDSTYRLHQNENCTCCFRQILPPGVLDKSDNKFKLHYCVKFPQDFLVPTNVTAMITYCRRPPYDKLSQKDAFGFVHPREDSIEYNETSSGRRPSVLLWGIDSMSRMTLELTMPRMYEYLNAQHWFELQGYNKMGINTFPNLMAVLTGFNESYAKKQCRPDKAGGLDVCPLIWKDFKDKGYTTAFAEDWSLHSTFNWKKVGFLRPPTDVYGRPLILAAEKMIQKAHYSEIPFCLGRKPAAEYVYDLAVQFSRVNRNSTFFGLFWTNTFSHNDFSMPSAMDEKMRSWNQNRTIEGIGYRFCGGTTALYVHPSTCLDS